jgi:hypothetical protein
MAQGLGNIKRNSFKFVTETQRGDVMNTGKQPSKEEIRAWLKDQIGQNQPPPDPKQIRRELGWHLKPHPSHPSY